MRVRILYFAVARERAGVDREIVDVNPGLTVGELMNQIVGRHPPIGEIRAALRIAVNLEFVTADTVLYDGDELALIPPVSGGDGR